MMLRLYDTYTRRLRDFEPLQTEVGLYACGPTVYNYAHLGNLRTYLFVDILRRTLEFAGYRVRHVMNITDVGHLVSDADTGEDKMEVGSQRTGNSAWEIADYYSQAFKDDLSQLNILEPTVWCRATDHIPEQIDAIRCIEEAGYTYRTADGIYFDTSRLPTYGYLGRLDTSGLQAGARVEMGEKRSPTDFALWKFSPTDRQRQMEWPSPWGVGFPGWHIECSAMATKYLGSYFDIHCGGEDHISVHHPNEIAQTEACHGTRLANFWMHGYFLESGEARMAKSAGDFLRVQSLIERNLDPLAFRLFCLGAHYRSKVTFTWDSLEGAATALQRLRTVAWEWGAPDEGDEGFGNRFRQEIGDDLNLPRALALTWELVRSELPDAVKKATLLEYDRVLGLGLAEWQPERAEAPEAIQALVQEREKARAERQWEEADALRARVEAAGYTIEDTPDGPRLRPRPDG